MCRYIFSVELSMNFCGNLSYYFRVFTCPVGRYYYIGVLSRFRKKFYFFSSGWFGLEKNIDT